MPKDTLGITQRAIAFLSDKHQRIIVQLKPLLLCNAFEVCGDLVNCNSAEVEALTAGENGRGELVDFRRGKDEHHVRRRLFKRLQERVECLLR